MMPERIARLPRDKRGYPIPWNVLVADDGTPFFTVNDDRKAWRAVREGLCPICGERLGRWCWLVGGPRSAFDPYGAYLDLPMHRDCGEFSLATCPYLALPRYLGRIDVVNPEKLPPEARILLNETMIPERPELFVAVLSDKIQLLDNSPLLPHFRPIPPFVEWTFWRHGQQIPAHRAMPILRGIFGADWEPPGKDVI
jgi:hypothetical protein